MKFASVWQLILQLRISRLHS